MVARMTQKTAAITGAFAILLAGGIAGRHARTWMG
jgi:hypothetical protein